MMSIVHFKLCKSWGGAVEVLGPAVIVNHGVFYVYCFFPLTYFDYLVPRMKYEMAPMLAVLFFGMSVMLKVFSGAKREVKIYTEIPPYREMKINIFRLISSKILW